LLHPITRAAKLSVVLSSRPAPIADARDSSVLGADSLFANLSFGALLILLLSGPYELSGFWPATYDFWPQSLFLLLSAAVALLMALSPDLRPRLNTTAWLLLAFFGWNVAATLTSVYKHDSWLEVARLAGPLAVFFAVRVFYNRDRALWILGAWCLGMALVCVLPLADFAQTRFSRQTGTFYNANLFANALAMTLPVALVFPVLVGRRFGGTTRVVAFLPFFICAMGLVVTSSKGGFVAAMLALLVTAALVWRAKNATIRAVVGRNRAAFAGGTIVLCLLFAVVASKTILPRLQQVRGTDDNSTMFRVYTWRGTLEMAQAAPLLGHGPASFPHVYPRYAQAGYTRSAHQSWLQIAAESGFVSLLLIFAAMGVALKNGLKQGRSPDWPLATGLTGALVALVAHGFFDSGWSATSILIFLAVSLAILSSLGSDKEEQSATISQSRLNPFWLGAYPRCQLGQSGPRRRWARFPSLRSRKTL
jgi:O-antigen ligase